LYLGLNAVVTLTCAEQSMTKPELRKRYLDKRKSLTEAACVHFNQQLYHLFFAHFDLSFIKVVHLYLPLEKNKEPDTWQILDRIRREFPHIKISIPKVNNQTSELENFYFEGLHETQKNIWGIPEPTQGIPTLSSEIDLVLVPLLVFDEKGNRVGYGKGFYDRFLKQCREDCKKVGLSFFDPIEQIIDVNEFDVKMEACITPSEVYTF